jgi:hypothetical protein
MGSGAPTNLPGSLKTEILDLLYLQRHPFTFQLSPVTERRLFLRI